MVESQGATVDAVAIAFGALSVVSISLRLWARIFVVKSFGPDDCEYLPYLVAYHALIVLAELILTVRRQT